MFEETYQELVKMLARMGMQALLIFFFLILAMLFLEAFLLWLEWKGRKFYGY